MKVPRLFVVLVSVLAAVSIVAAQNAASSQEALQGTWKGEELGRGDGGEWKLVISSDSIRIDGPEKREWYEGTFKVVEDQNPKQLQATITNCVAAEFIGKLAMSIFKIEGNTLTLTGNHPGSPDAPKDFDASSCRRFVFKKESASK